MQRIVYPWEESVREMSQQSSANCPKCDLVLRFTVGKSAAVALKCPGCGHLFETQVRSTQSNKPEKKVVVAKVVSGPTTKPASQPSEEIFEGELVEDELLEGVLIEEPVAAAVPSEPTPLLRPKLNKPASKKKNKPSRPTASKPIGRSTGNLGPNKWVFPVAIGGGVAAVLACAALFFSGVLSSTADQSTPAIVSAERLNGVVRQYVTALKGVTDGESRKPAAKELEGLKSELESIVFTALSCGEVEDGTQSDAVRSLMTDGSAARAEILSESRRINSNYPLDDKLYAVDLELKSLVHAIEQHLNYSLTALTAADSPVQRTCASSIAVKRRIVSTMAQLKDGADTIATVESLQRMSDELNMLAEEHSKTGHRISVMAHEYESANRAADAMRQWLGEYIEDRLQPEPELQYTLEEVESTASRVELAFRAGVSRLATTTKQRVDARLFAMNIVPKSQDNPIAQTTTTPSSIASIPKATPSRLKPEANPTPAVSPDRVVVSSKPSVLQPAATLPAATPPQSSPSKPEAALAGSALIGGSSSSSTPARVNTSSDYSPQEQPPARFTGGSSVQIKVFGAEKEALETDFRSLVSMLGVPQSDIAGSGDRVTMSFPYSGSLYKVAKLVGFGEVQCCDTQSRTLFVHAQ